MGKTDILIGKKATWGSDDESEDDDRPRRRTEAGEFSESGEDEAPPPTQTYVPPHLARGARRPTTRGRSSRCSIPRKRRRRPKEGDQ